MLIPFFLSAQLTGYWETETGGCYQIRQKDNKVWWTYEENTETRAKNVFFGEIFNRELIGHWCDLPSHSRNNCNEQLTLRIESNNRMVKIYESKSYTGNTWRKLNGPCSSSGNSTDTNTGDNAYGEATDDPCFRVYPNMRLPYNTKGSPVKCSVKEAMETCKKEPWCKAFGYNPKTKKAYFKLKNLKEVPLIESSNDHYYNICRD